MWKFSNRVKATSPEPVFTDGVKATGLALLLIISTLLAVWFHLVICERPSDYILCWGLYGLVYLFLTYPLFEIIRSRIYKLVIPANNHNDETTWNFAGLISLAVLTGIAVSIILLIIDYIGHSSIVDKTQGNDGLGVIGGSHSGMAADHLGTFGDFFGGTLNPLLTFGTLVGLAITILMQRVQIREARSEAEASRDVAQKQVFETTFFNLLSLHSQITERLAFDTKLLPTPHEAYSAMRYPGSVTYKVIRGKEIFGEILQRTLTLGNAGNIQLSLYRGLQNDHNYIFGHYFRNLYQILNLVDKFSVRGDESEKYKIRKKYANILRAQLSTHELSVLLLNCSFEMVDGGEFRDLLRKYKFLEHLQTSIVKGELNIAHISPALEWIVFEYFDIMDREERRVWSSGAFGKNPAIKQYLERQKTDSKFPLPCKEKPLAEKLRNKSNASLQ